MKKLLLIGLAMMLLGACKTKSVVTETETSVLKNDSTYESSITMDKDSSFVSRLKKDSVYYQLMPGQKTSMDLGNPCDSMSGLLRAFEMQTGKTKVVSDGISIKVSTECEESIKEFQRISDEALEVANSEHERANYLKAYFTSDAYIKTVQKTTKQPFWNWTTMWLTLVGLGLIWLIIKMGIKILFK